MYKVISAAVGIFFFCLLSFSCAPTLYDVVSDSEVLEKISFNQEKIQSFRGIGKAYFSLKEGRGTLEVIIVAQKPGSLRIETGNFFGLPLTTMTLHQNRMQYYEISSEKFFEGQKSSYFLRAILPLGLNDRDLLGLLFFSQSTYEKMKKSLRYKLELMGIRKREKDEYYYPRALRLTDQKTKEFIHLTWQAYDLNPKGLKSRLFWIQKPSYAQLIQIGTATTSKPLFQGQSPQPN